MSTLYYESELYHHGVKGMKWGHRKNYASDSVKSARSQYKSAKKAYNKSFNKAYNRGLAVISPFKKSRQANDARWEKAIKDADNLNEAKAKLKNAKKNEKIKSVEEYSKAMDKASKMSDISDQKWNEVKKARMDLGKNAVQRMIASVKNDTAAAKKYNKMVEDASTYDDEAFMQTMKAKELYKKTGSTAASRIYNNAKYRR